MVRITMLVVVVEVGVVDHLIAMVVVGVVEVWSNLNHNRNH